MIKASIISGACHFRHGIKTEAFFLKKGGTVEKKCGQEQMNFQEHILRKAISVVTL
jgi:hypothetical protein